MLLFGLVLLMGGLVVLFWQRTAVASGLARRRVPQRVRGWLRRPPWPWRRPRRRPRPAHPARPAGPGTGRAASSAANSAAGRPAGAGSARSSSLRSAATWRPRTRRGRGNLGPRLDGTTVRWVPGRAVVPPRSPELPGRPELPRPRHVDRN